MEPLRILAFLLLPLGFLLAEEKPWYEGLLVGIEVGPTGANDRDDIYMSRANGKDIVQNILKAKAQYLVIFMKDQNFAYYNSKIARKCPQLKDMDLLKEVIEEAKKHSIPVIAYVQVQYDTSSWLAHPEWRMKDWYGNDIPGRLCYNSGYIEFIKSILEELMSYDIAGFHIDMLDWGFSPPYGCWCDKCREAFKKEYGMDMPSKVSWDENWEKVLEFRYKSDISFCRELERFVHSHRPELSIDFNYHGYPPFSWWTAQKPVGKAEDGDFVTAEGLPFVFGHTNPSFLALFMKGARSDGRTQGVTSVGVYDYHDFTVRPTAELKWEVMTYLAHGALCTIVDKANYDGTFNPLVYERLGVVFGEALRQREFFGHKPIPEVGIYFSLRTRDWFGREEPIKYFSAVMGAHKALKEAHIPMAFIMDENISLEKLLQFPVVYLPNVAILSEEEVALFKEYLKRGGKILATGLTACYDRQGNPLGRCLLEGVIGAKLLEIYAAHKDNYVHFPESIKDEIGLIGVPKDVNILNYSPIAIFQPIEAKSYGELLVAYRSQDNPWMGHMSAERVVGPAILMMEYGKGRIVYLPFSPDSAFVGNYRMPEHRNLIASIIRYLNPKPPIIINTQPHIETVITKDEEKNRYIIHFLCFCGTPTSAVFPFPEGRRVLPSLMEFCCPYEAEIEINFPFSSVEAIGPKGNISPQGDKLMLRSSNIHEVVVINQ